MNFFDYIYKESYIIILLFAIIFYILSKVNINSLIIIIILSILSYGIIYYLNKLSIDKDTALTNKANLFDNDISNRSITNDNIFYIHKFPKISKYIKYNEKLMNIISNIRFIRKFNKSIYGDIILNANNMMKVYIYILINRYDPVDYIQIYVNLRDNILEKMNSLIMIIPEKFKHTYGFSPNKEIYDTINNFKSYTNEMLNILENYSKIHLQKVYIPDNSVMPYNIAKLSPYVI